MILSFDTSNYTTSCCLFDPLSGVVWQNRILLHPPENQRGLRQSDVVFLHTKNLEVLLDGFPNDIPISGIVATATPRPENGSYMPCFLVGKNYGVSLSKILNIPFMTFSHQENHIAAAFYSSGNMDLLEKRFIAFHISGGTSDIVEVSKEENGLSITSIGGSLDLHAGQLIDRIGVLLGLRFPCGKELEKLAKSSNNSLIKHTSVSDTFFHLSGFENQAMQFVKENVASEDIARFALDCILFSLQDVIQNIRKKDKDIPLLFAGGVMSNQYISDTIRKNFDHVYFSDPFYSSDHALGNAVMYSIFHK